MCIRIVKTQVKTQRTLGCTLERTLAYTVKTRRFCPTHLGLPSNWAALVIVSSWVTSVGAGRVRGRFLSRYVVSALGFVVLQASLSCPSSCTNCYAKTAQAQSSAMQSARRKPVLEVSPRIFAFVASARAPLGACADNYMRLLTVLLSEWGFVQNLNCCLYVLDVSNRLGLLLRLVAHSLVL